MSDKARRFYNVSMWASAIVAVTCLIALLFTEVAEAKWSRLYYVISIAACLYGLIVYSIFVEDGCEYTCDECDQDQGP